MIGKKKNEKNNQTIALNILYAKKEKICAIYYVSKQNSNSEKQVILSLIPNGEGRHYLAAKIYQPY